jgi:hypothetical protein
MTDLSFHFLHNVCYKFLCILARDTQLITFNYSAADKIWTKLTACVTTMKNDVSES